METANTANIDHDKNFKELISTFFLEFLELFLPAIATTIEPDSITFLQQEYFVDVGEGKEKIIDLLAQVKQSGRDATFLIHLEAQASSEARFNRRLFHYFAILHQRHDQDIYPIVIFSFDQPYRAEENTYKVEFPTRKVLEFSFEAIQLNRLNWRDYINQLNPVAAALMAKMKIAKKDRPKVKAECLRLLVTLKLDPAKTRLVSKFVDTYLRLNQQEERVFQSEIGKMETTQQEQIMQVTTSWEEIGIEKGIEQGIEQGIERERRSLVLRQLNQKLGSLPTALTETISARPPAQLEILAIALLNFTTVADLETWLQEN
jgi:predicted transposase/invertase (TIGR01784 family)